MAHTQPIDYDTLPIWFGSSGTTYEGHFSGLMDEVSIYNRALSAQDITDLYNAPNAPLAVLTSSLPNGTTNTAYSQTLNASGGFEFVSR